MSVWDDPELRVSDDYVKFDNVGDTVTGTIVSLRAHRFDDGKVVPQILLDTADGERTLTAGQVRLKAALAEKRPEVGDTLTVTLTNIEKRAGGKTLKVFDVAVTPAGAPAAAVNVADVTTITTPGAPGAAALTDEQKAALAAMGISLPA
jgi:hypothetical protein